MRGRSPTPATDPGRAQGECQLGGDPTPRKFRVPEPPWPSPVSLLESCSQRILGLSALQGTLVAQGLLVQMQKSLFTSMWESQKEVVIGFHFMFPKEPFCMFLQLILY